MMPLGRRTNIEVQTLLHTAFMDLVGASTSIVFLYMVVTGGSTLSCFQL